MSQPAIVCKGLFKNFDDQTAVQDVSFSVSSGTILALLGPSGCGKTTTLRLIAGFEELDSGSILIAGRVVAADDRRLPPEKRRVGMVFQDYAIFPHLSIAENIGFGLDRGPEKQARIQEMLHLVGLPGDGRRMPHELSGGQQQRVALARALAPKPDVLLLDEPFSNLDASLRFEVREEIKSLLKRSGTTAVFVTHDQDEALFLGDEVAIMKDGRLEQIGSPLAVFHLPRTRFVAEFLGQTDFITGQVNGGEIVTALGDIPWPGGLNEGGEVEIGVRPDDVQLTADTGGNSQILSRRFTGIAFIYKVRLADGSIVHSWQSHQIEFPDGALVKANIRPGHQLACFSDGLAV